MKIKPIKTVEESQTTLAEIEQLFATVPDSPKGDRLKMLSMLVETCEQRQFSIPAKTLIQPCQLAA